MNHEFSQESLEQIPLETSRLPKGWGIARIADITSEIAPGFASGVHDSDGKGYPHLRPMNIDRNGRIDLSVVKSVPSTQDKTLLAGDILFNNTNSPDLVGKTALIGERENGFAFSNHMTRIRLGGGQSPRYFAHFLHFLWMSGYMKHRCTNHVNQASISTKTLANTVPLLVPPPSEQARIAEKLEELLSDLDAGVAELKAAQHKLAQYRQSLLKAAVEGALTADWRAARGKLRETGTELLKLILSERRARWEQKQLAKFAEQGKAPPKDWQATYPEPVAPNVAELPALPEGWVWASVDQLASVGTGVTPLRSNRGYFDGGDIPWTTSGALNDEIVISASGYVTKLAVSECRLELYPAGTLLVAMYGEGKTRGKCAELAFPSTINQAIAAITFEGSALDARPHVKIFFLDAYEAMRKQASGGVQPNLNLQIIKALSVPLPPLAEQLEIHSQLQEQLSSYERFKDSIEIALAQAVAQRKNLLKAAFAGQLVPQDPNDEPASELLARIPAARECSLLGRKRGSNARSAK